MTHVEITEDPIALEGNPHSTLCGGELRFLGIVRGREGEDTITGIHYSAYRPMAEQLLQAIAEEGRTRFGEHDLRLIHRIHFVAEAEASIVIEVRFAHSREAFEACQWYLDRVKTAVPIWKDPVFADAKPSTTEA